AIEDLRQCRWDQYGPDYLSLRRTEGQSRLDQLLRHQSNGRHYDRQQINEDAEEQKCDLLFLINAKPENQQGNERRDRHVTQRRHDRFEETIDRIERAHQHTEWQRDGGRQQKRDRDPARRNENCFEQVVLNEKLECAANNFSRFRQKARFDESTVRENTPGPEYEHRRHQAQNERRLLWQRRSY